MVNFDWQKLAPPNEEKSEKRILQMQRILALTKLVPRRGEGGRQSSPWAWRVMRIRGSETRKVRRIRRKRIGKKKSSEDPKNGGRSTRRPGGSADKLQVHAIRNNETPLNL